MDIKNPYLVNKASLKIEKENAYSLIYGYEPKKTTIYCAHQNAWSLKGGGGVYPFQKYPKLITVSKSKKYNLSETARAINTDHVIIPKRFIAFLDTIFHIRNDKSIWDKLCKDGTFNLWPPEEADRYFEKTSDSMILLLRVCIIEGELQISEEPTSDYYDDVIGNREVSVIGPVISDLEFKGIKDNIRSVLQELGKLKREERMFDTITATPESHLEEKIMEKKDEEDEEPVKIRDYNQEFLRLKNEGRLEFITFHPSYCYEEFMEGITIKEDDKTSDKGGASDAGLAYCKKDGIFKQLCKVALADLLEYDNTGELGYQVYDGENRAGWVQKIKDTSWDDIWAVYSERKKENGSRLWNDEEISKKRAVLLIDEINRGDISKIFGELITLLEKDKRLDADREINVQLQYTNHYFGVPPNVYVIGTMNTADRSIALIDTALRRRFGFYEMMPQLSLLENKLKDSNEEDVVQVDTGAIQALKNSIVALEKINARITDSSKIGRDKQIGHSFLWAVETNEDIWRAWRFEILPLLEEYCYGKYDLFSSILFGENASKIDTGAYFSKQDGLKLEQEDIQDFLELVAES